MMAQCANLASEVDLMMKIDTFDTNFKSNSSSIGNAERLLGIELTSRLYKRMGLLGIELTYRLYKRVCWALNSRAFIISLVLFL